MLELKAKAIEKFVSDRLYGETEEDSSYGWTMLGTNVARWSDANVTVRVILHTRSYRWSDPTGRYIEERPKYSAAVWVMLGGHSVPVWATRGELRGPACGVWSEAEGMISTALSFAAHDLGEDSEHADTLGMCAYMIDEEEEADA